MSFFDGMRITPKNKVLLNGLELIENTKYFQKGYSNDPVKKNRNKRIQKKWIKKYGYKPIIDNNVYIFENKVLMGHPITIKKILREAKKNVIK